MLGVSQDLPAVVGKIVFNGTQREIYILQDRRVFGHCAAKEGEPPFEVKKQLWQGLGGEVIPCPYKWSFRLRQDKVEVMVPRRETRDTPVDELWLKKQEGIEEMADQGLVHWTGRIFFTEPYRQSTDTVGVLVNMVRVGLREEVTTDSLLQNPVLEGLELLREGRDGEGRYALLSATPATDALSLTPLLEKLYDSGLVVNSTTRLLVHRPKVHPVDRRFYDN